MPRRPAPELLVAIGDLHGHARALDRILAALHARHAILGPRGGLRAGVTLVTVGDHIDRGAHGTTCPGPREWPMIEFARA